MRCFTAQDPDSTEQVLQDCADPAGADCVNGTSCAFLPRAVADELKAEHGRAPFVTGVFAYLGYGIEPHGRSSGAIVRPPEFALLRAAATARLMQAIGIRFIPMVNGPGTLQQFRDVVGNNTSREEYVARLVADAKRFDFDGYSFDWELGSFTDVDARDFAELLVDLQTRLQALGLGKAHVSAAVGGIGAYGVPGTAGFCDRVPCVHGMNEACKWWNCSEVDPATLGGSNISVLTMNTYDSREPCWYRYVAAINSTVPRHARGIGLKANTASASQPAVYMNPTALARRFAAIESSDIDQIGLYGSFTFNALHEYVPLLQKFLGGQSDGGNFEWPTFPPMVCN